MINIIMIIIIKINCTVNIHLSFICQVIVYIHHTYIMDFIDFIDI